MNYEDVKALANAEGISVTDYLALSPNNDPYYVGAPAQLEKAQWFAQIYKKMGSPAQCHVRRVHYWLVSSNYLKPNGKTYENTDNDWHFVTVAAKYARYLGLVPIENIIDRRNPPPLVNVNCTPHRQASAVRDEIGAESLIEQIVGNFQCYNPSLTQAYMLEIWCEKSTMNDVLEPICAAHGANLVTGLGELSISAVYQLVCRIRDVRKPTRIFYVSDFDPAGECMPVSVSRKIEYLNDHFGLSADVKLLPIILNAEQCRRLKLPRTPIKETEKRRAGFEERYGTGATELDALEALYPGEMETIVTAAMAEYFDKDAWDAADRKNDELREEVRLYLSERISDRLVNRLMSRLDTGNFDSYSPRKAEANEDDELAPWLFDSSRDYSDQLDAYRRHQNNSRKGRA